MSTAYDDRPFGPGQVENGVNADSNPVLRHWLGRKARFDDCDYTVSGLASGRSPLSACDLEAVCLRNNSGITLQGKQLVQVTRTGREAVKDVIGYGNRMTLPGLVVVDPFLPSSGVPTGYCFWGFIKGVMLLKTPMVDADYNGDVAAFAPLCCVTAEFTTATTAGRIANLTLPGQTGATTSALVALNTIGRALSAKTTANTNVDILVAVNIPWLY